MTIKEAVNVYYAPSVQDFLKDTLTGLSQPNKSLPCKYFYDQEGCFYFDRICECNDYYVTRTEKAIMRQAINEIAQVVGPGRLIVEYGSGSAVKTGFLLANLKTPGAYIPIDIYPEYLEHTMQTFTPAFPDLEILPVCADFTKDFELPSPKLFCPHKLIYFPGSTIGNFSPDKAVELLGNMFQSCREGDVVLLGVDLKKACSILDQAYNDTQGYTAAFNLNLLKRINRELDGNFSIANFLHYAFYNETAGRIEMHLVSACDQIATVAGEDFYFREGETIHTESSYKYGLSEFKLLAQSAGFSTQHMWTDPLEYFAVFLLRVRPKNRS